MSNIDRYKTELSDLVAKGNSMLDDLQKNKNNASVFHAGYQPWYTQATEVVRQILPMRLVEFEELYMGKNRARKEINATTFTLQDWMLGVRSGHNTYTGRDFFDSLAIAAMRFQNQLSILSSAKSRFNSSLFDIKQMIQADLFDSELDAADSLNNHGFQRGAGAISGVVLEGHLIQVCNNHQLKITKKNPTINDLAQLLKDSDVIEMPDWRKIQHLADIRNLCDHKKTTDPTMEQITELIEGCKKLTKTLF
jgi:hypothetical protein